MQTLLQDLRFGVRMLLKRPGFTLVAVLTLALGIGANTAIFSVVNAVLLRPLPFKDPEQLVWVWGVVPKFSQANHSPVEFLAYQEQQKSFAELAAYRNMAFTLTGGAQPEHVQGLIATANYFSLLGVAAARGRTFQGEDGRPGAPRVAVFSHGLWQKRFGGDPNLIGRALTINGESVTVVGIMPPDFKLNPYTELWLNPHQTVPDFQMNFRGDALALRENHYLRIFARLQPGISLQQAQAELSAIGGRLEQQYPDQAGHGARVVFLHEAVVTDVRRTMLVLLGAVGLVLLIACANVTNLLLARATARYREMAIRAAVGASRFALMRQLLLESVLLSLCGGLGGWLLAMWGVKLILAFNPGEIPRLHEIRLDHPVFLFTLAVSLATGVIFGLAPALTASKTDLVTALKEGARSASAGAGRHRLRQGLVVTEVALALVVLIGAGLLVGSFRRLLAVSPGFDPDNLLTMWVALTSERYGTATANVQFLKELTARLEALPGVQSLAIGDDFPIQGTDTHDYPEIEGRGAAPEQRTLVGHHVINPRYFEALGIRLVKGRAFAERDDASSPRVVIINEAMANRVWPNEEALGKRIRFGPSSEPWSEIVGLVANVKHDGLHVADRPHCYSPHLQQPWPFLAIAIRTQTGQAAMLAAVRQAVQKIDPNLPIIDPRTMNDRDQMLPTRRLVLALFSLFAVVALLLAALGLYGVISYGVAQRTHELGIRIALGASSREVLRLIMAQGMWLVALGITLGVGCALALSRLLAKLLFGMSATDPPTFVVIVLLLTLVSLLACYLPARRATKVDPMIALRHE
ncbi:MAG: ABC transporter permease [Acidobacteria bacterium]|nr:ABC transporter permease [Acidobacteriota bacterium]